MTPLHQHAETLRRWLTWETDPTNSRHSMNALELEALEAGASALETVAAYETELENLQSAHQELIRKLIEARATLTQRGWQPIESAPLGTKALLYWVGDHAPCPTTIAAVVTYYEPGNALNAQPVEPLRAASYWDGVAYRSLEWVTHWQPLPSPPQEER